MQKKLIALAVAGLLSAPVMAQSNVTISGVVDMGIAHRSDNIADGVSSKTAIDSGIQSGNRVIFRGSEDLGNGLKANFHLEMGYFVDNGQSRGDGVWSRQSHLSLSGGFGSLSAGRHYSPQFSLLAGVDPFGTGLAGAANNVYAMDVRLSNSIIYTTPSMSGFKVAAVYSRQANGINQENLENAGDVRVWGISPTYSNGPLMVGFNYHRLKANVSGADATKVWDLAGTYNFGAAKLAAAYGNRDNGADSKYFLLGVTVPVGQAGNVLASYVRAKTDIGAADDPTSRMIAVGYTHSLSKRTNVYAAYATIKNSDGGAAAVGDASNGGQGYQKGLNLGVRHMF